MLMTESQSEYGTTSVSPHCGANQPSIILPTWVGTFATSDLGSLLDASRLLLL